MHFEEFESLEDAFDKMRQQEELANEMVQPYQKIIGWGDYWCRGYNEGPDSVMIYGHILTLEEMESREKECGADDDEWQYIKESMMNSYSRGYRFGDCYSTWEPRGELGSTHISQMVKITKEAFEFAQKNNWDAAQMWKDLENPAWDPFFILEEENES